MTKGMQTNNLKDFKTFIDSNSKLKDLTLDIQYKYNVNLNIYKEENDKIIKINPSDLFSNLMGGNSANGSNQMMATYNIFTEMIDNKELLESQYDLLAGSWPTNENELVLIVDENNEISDYVLYTLGIKNQDELQGIMEKVMKGEEVESEKTSYTYADLLNLEYKLVLPTSLYEKENNYYKEIDTEDRLKEVVSRGLDL